MKEKKSVFGYQVSDLIGIVLMVIPFLISVLVHPEKKFLGLIPMGKYDIMPEFDVALIACALYLAIIVRYNFFRTNTVVDTIISIFRTFLNIWVLSAFLMFVVPDGIIKREIFWLVVLFMWLGMKSVAGYGWTIIVIMGVINATTTSEAFGGWGALFVIFLTISLLLQVSSVVNIKDFMQEFKGDNNLHKAVTSLDGQGMNDN